MKSEFEFIENLRRRFDSSKIGDDCAVIPKDSKSDLVITTDLLVEEIDFKLDWTTPEFLGHKALAVSLSDIAAMGAKPAWAMLSIGIPEKIWKTDFVQRFYDGWFKLAAIFNVELVGGDVSKTPDKIVIDSIAAGEVKRGRAVLRSTAQPNEMIFVTGALGGAAAGLSLLKSGMQLQNSKSKNLFLRQLTPMPQSEIGEFLGTKRIASAMIDLSDGLSSDLAHICRASGVGARIFAKDIPFEKNMGKFAKSIDEKLNFALNSGEDYELLFTVNTKKYFYIADKLKNKEIFHIGMTSSNANIIELIKGKEALVLEPKGFRHF